MAKLTESYSKPLITMKETNANFVDFKEVKASVTMSQILEHYGLLESLKKESKGYAGPCPFCGSNGRSFRATDGIGFHCFSCKAKGNLLDFVQLKENCQVRSAALKIVSWFNLQRGEPSLPPAKSKGRKKKKKGTKKGKKTEKSAKPLAFTLKLDAKHPWLREAGIKPETVAEFGLGYCSKGQMEGCIAFPIHDLNHNLVGYAGYHLESVTDPDFTWKFPPQLDLSQVVYNCSRTDPTGPGDLILSQDPLDLVHRWQSGECRTVALLDKALSKAQVTILESLV